MKILLTGPTGFIGSAFARLALSQGHQIAGLLLPGEAIPPGMPAGQSLVWLRGTIAAAPWSEIADFKPEICVHTAWITTPGVYLESPENDVFRDASLSFLQKSCGLGVRHILSLGTCIEYRIGPQPLSEDATPVQPTTRYARSKNDLRLALEAGAREHGYDLCWARVFYPYGPGEHPSRLCSSIIARLGRGEEILLKTPGSVKDYIYIEDLASAILAVLEHRFEGAINLGTGAGISVESLARQVGGLLGKPQLIKVAELPDADPFPCVVADNRKLKSLGWQPAVSCEEGLRRLVDYRVRG
jgi:dTDP-6-deoxy-L-talose 4-dehydrogenase (NAD+)